MRTIVLTHILLIILILNIFKDIGVFKEEIEFYTTYFAMEIFSGLSTTIVDHKINGDDKNE
jgi:hypothetical protein